MLQQLGSDLPGRADGGGVARSSDSPLPRLRDEWRKLPLQRSDERKASSKLGWQRPPELRPPSATPPSVAPSPGGSDFGAEVGPISPGNFHRDGVTDAVDPTIVSDHDFRQQQRWQDHPACIWIQVATRPNCAAKVSSCGGASKVTVAVKIMTGVFETGRQYAVDFKKNMTIKFDELQPNGISLSSRRTAENRNLFRDDSTRLLRSHGKCVCDAGEHFQARIGCFRKIARRIRALRSDGICRIQIVIE